jgi:hypothetical protein
MLELPKDIMDHADYLVVSLSATAAANPAAGPQVQLVLVRNAVAGGGGAAAAGEPSGVVVAVVEETALVPGNARRVDTDNAGGYFLVEPVLFDIRGLKEKADRWYLSCRVLGGASTAIQVMDYWPIRRRH